MSDVTQQGQQPLLNDTVQATCRRCRRTFQASSMECMGLKLTATICASCSEVIAREEKESQEAARQRAILRNAKAREETWSRMCPAEFRLPTEDSGHTQLAKLELEQPKVGELLKWTGPRGLIIRGATGKCKTRAMWRLVRRLYVEGKRVIVLTAGQFDRQCRDAGGNFTLTNWFDRLAECDVFVLDDLGQGAWTEATEAQWFSLVDERSSHDKPIIVTTQHTGQSLAESAGGQSKKLLRAEAMIRRLRDYCETIVFT